MYYYMLYIIHMNTSINIYIEYNYIYNYIYNIYIYTVIIYTIVLLEREHGPLVNLTSNQTLRFQG